MSADEPYEPAADDEPAAAPARAADPARELIDRLRRAAPPGNRGRRAASRRRNRPVIHPDDQAWSGARGDERDPLALAASVDRLVEEHNWRRTLDQASLEPRWSAIVGDAVAQHCRPDSLSGGVLVVRAESTAWATQLRLMARGLLERINAEVGEGVVTRVQIVGPNRPDWRHGPLRVRGRGPRDTYG